MAFMSRLYQLRIGTKELKEWHGLAQRRRLPLSALLRA